MKELTRYQSLIVKYLEAEYGHPICEVLRYFRDMPLRFEDIARLADCSPKTLQRICETVGYNDNVVVIVDKKKAHYPNGTNFLKSFETTEDAVIHCRHDLKLTIEETQEKLGISKTTIWRNTPEGLKFLCNSNRERLVTKRSPSDDHPWQNF